MSITASRSKVVDFSEGGEAKVSNFEVHVVVNEDIFKFKVSMDNSFAVHVLDNVAHLIQGLDNP